MMLSVFFSEANKLVKPLTVKNQNLLVRLEFAFLKLLRWLTFRAGTGYKKCSFNSSSPTSPVCPTQETPDAWQEVFQKTLALFCAVQESGCPFQVNEISDSSDWPQEEEDEDCPEFAVAQDLYEVLRDGRASEQDSRKCPGRIILSRDRYHRPFLQ
jgi:hypothetical protein